jgi:hypothetical protein
VSPIAAICPVWFVTTSTVVHFVVVADVTIATRGWLAFPIERRITRPEFAVMISLAIRFEESFENIVRKQTISFVVIERNVE